MYKNIRAIQILQYLNNIHILIGFASKFDSQIRVTIYYLKPVFQKSEN